MRISLLLGLWLAVALSMPAAPLPPPEYKPEMQVSTYKPSKQRDPLLQPGAALNSGNSAKPIVAPVNFAFRLEGILLHPTTPAALVNDTLVYLNKPVKLTDGQNEIVVTLTEIQRDRIVLEAGGQKRELRLARPQAGGK